MNIVYIDHYAGSPEMGMEFRPYYLSREWVKMGHKVSIIAGDFSHLRKENPTVKKDMTKQTIDGVDYYWIRTGRYDGNGVARALTMRRFTRKLNRWKRWISRNLQPDVVISSSTYPVDSIPAYKIARFGDKKACYIHEVHDMWPATPIELGEMSQKNPFIIWMQRGEDYACRHADAVISLLKYAGDHLVERGLKKERFFYIPNGIEMDEWENPEELPPKHRKRLNRLKKEGKFIVGYFGGHALSNCLGTLIDSAGRMQNREDVHFVLVGSGVEKKKLIAAAEGLDNITFLPPVKKRAIPTLTSYFDCTYIGAKDSPLYRFGTCLNKMYDSMMAGKPIILAINTPPTPVEECRCGMAVPPENVDAIVEAIEDLTAMSEDERKAMGQRGTDEVLKKNTYRVLAEDFLKVIKKVR